MPYPGVYRAEYRDKKTGQKRLASTWIASYWDYDLQKTVKEYGFTSALIAAKHRAAMMAKLKNEKLRRVAISSGTLVLR